MMDIASPPHTANGTEASPRAGDNGPEFLEEIGHVRLQQAYTTSGARDNEIGYAPERSAAARGRLGAVLTIARYLEAPDA
jgi:hypothetical protein